MQEVMIFDVDYIKSAGLNVFIILEVWNKFRNEGRKEEEEGESHRVTP